MGSRRQGVRNFFLTVKDRGERRITTPKRTASTWGDVTGVYGNKHGALLLKEASTIQINNNRITLRPS